MAKTNKNLEDYTQRLVDKDFGVENVEILAKMVINIRRLKTQTSQCGATTKSTDNIQTTKFS